MTYTNTGRIDGAFDLTPHVGPNIRRLADREGITLQMLAEWADISFSSLKRYIMRYGGAKQGMHLDRIAKVLRVTPENLQTEHKEDDE